MKCISSKRLAFRFGLFILCVIALVVLCGTALAGYNPLTVAAEGGGITVYTDSSGSRKAGILYNGYTDHLDLEPTNGRYGCRLTQDYSIWLNEEKAMSRLPQQSEYADYDEWKAQLPCGIFLAEIVQDNAPVYTSPRHKHESARHAQGTLIKVCGEFGDDYYVGGVAYGFIAKSAVRKIADMTYPQAHSDTYIYDGLSEQTIYASEAEPAFISATATGYSEDEIRSFIANRQFIVLRELGDWVQLAGGGFLEKRFLEPDGDHSYPVAYVKTDGQLDRLNVRWCADTNSAPTVKLCSGVPVHVVSHTEKWAVIFVTGPNGGVMKSGCVQMQYLSFGAQDSVRDGMTKVRLTQDLQGDESMVSFSVGGRGTGGILPSGTIVTVLGVGAHDSGKSSNVDRFLCETEEGRCVSISNPGILEPVSSTGIHATVRSAVRMRTEPNSEAAVLRQVKAKAKVEVFLRGETWTLVKYKNETGYMMSRYLSFP